MPLILYIAFGSALGGMLRYLCTVLIERQFAQYFGIFPLATLFINVLGSFLFGILASCISHAGWRAFVLVGVLGSFTTFSTFAVQISNLGLREHAFWTALLYLALSVILGILAAYIGHQLGQQFQSAVSL